MLLFFFLACTANKESDLGDPVALIDYVDPMIATGGVGYGVNCGYPGANVPLGMVKLSPDSASATDGADGYYRGGGYHYDDVKIQGFSHMHLYATGITGHGVLATMPVDGMSLARTTRDGYGAAFSHDQEWATPGHYEVHLDGVEVELTATDHTGLHEYRFDSSVVEPTVLIDVAHSMGRGEVTDGWISVDADLQSFEGGLTMDGELGGPFPMWFYGQLENPALAAGTWGADELSLELNRTQVENQPIGAWLELSPGATMRMRIALSNVDLEGAKLNFQNQHRGWDIATDVADARQRWEEKLSAVEVWGGSESERQIFATALYHSLQMPSLYSDSDHRYRGFDGQIHQANRPFYSDFSLWDTYRTTHPLYTLLWPELHSDLLWSLSRMATQGNGLPRWPLANADTGVMLGTSVNIVVAEALLKGIGDFEAAPLTELAVDALLNGAPLEFGAPPDLDAYAELGYWPADEVGRSVAWTQEQSVADFALGSWLQQDGQTEAAAVLLERSGYWQNLWNPETGFFHGRNRDGSFSELTSESQWTEDYAEGNARQYLWMAPHDPETLMATIGPDHLDRLRQFFEQMVVNDDSPPGLPETWYWHGNEIDLHAAFLFATAGAPEETNQWVQWIMENRYRAAPDGLAGNDDGGTLSAWYVWASMGLYPLAGTDRYVLTTPIWEQVRVALPNGELLISRASDPAQRNELSLENNPLDQAELRHHQLGRLRFGSD